jgi:uncharacterized protein DUF3822
MLQKTFSYYSDDLEDVDLFVEAGRNHIVCWCKKKNDKRLKAFEFFLCDDYTETAFVALIKEVQLHSRLLSIRSNKTNFFWNTGEVLCLPPSTQDDAIVNTHFELMFGNTANTKIFSASANDCVVAWRLKYEQQRAAEELFRKANFSHHYVPLFSQAKADDTICYLFFYPNYFSLVVYSAGLLQLAQTKKYKASEDVLYFVLNAFEQYNIAQHTNVICAGFVDERSKLYELLYLYLENLKLMNVDEATFNDKAFSEYSQHYFLPYINYTV